MMRRPRLTTGLLGAILVLSSCSGSVSTGGGDAVKTDELEKQVAAAIEAKTGNDVPEVTCPDELPAKVGATTTCKLGAGAGTFDVAVKAKSIKDGKVKMDFTIDGDQAGASDANRPTVAILSAAELAKKVSATLEEQVGQTPPPISCPETLEATVGATTTCILDDGESQYEVAVDITAVKGADVDFNIKVADQPVN